MTDRAPRCHILAATSRRRLDEIFGSEIGSEEAQPSRPEESACEESARERWYLDNRPPHHDDAGAS